MIKICLAGGYPAGTQEQMQNALPAEEFSVVRADAQAEFDAVTDADIVVLRVLKMPKAAFERFTKLKLILRWGVGYDSVDIEEAGRRGITVCNTPGANAYAVAELAVALMINVGRNLVRYDQNVRQGQWDRNVFPSNLTLNGKTVGLIGGGNIGRQVAKRVQAFGASVKYYDLFRLSPDMEREFGMTYCELEELLAASDVVSLHVPLLDSTRHIVGAEQLSQMKRGAILINTARGGLVDDGALVRALEEGKLSGAGLDCVEAEGSESTNALLAMPNVIITPHIGGTTSDLGSAIIPMLLENIRAFQRGSEIRYVVNSQYLK